MTTAEPITSPVQIEQAIRECSNRIAKGVMVCDQRYTAFLEADHAYDIAYAKAYIEAGGAAHERKYIAELATVDERRARDVADGLYRYAANQAKALQDELRSWQSVGASVRQMFSVAGRGDF